MELAGIKFENHCPFTVAELLDSRLRCQFKYASLINHWLRPFALRLECREWGIATWLADHDMLEFIAPSAGIIDGNEGCFHGRGSLIYSIAARAEELRSVGLGRGDRIVVASCSAISALIDLFSAWQIGATVVMVSPKLTAVERANVVVSTRVAAWVGDEACVGAIHLSGAPLIFSSREPPLAAPLLSLDEPALMLLTSGTTSVPKGVVHSLRSLMARIQLNLAFIQSADLSRSLNILPMNFGHGLIGNVLTPLASGAAVVLWPEPGVADLAKLGPIIDKLDVSFMSSVPAVWRVALRLSPRPTRGTLRRIHIGSAPLSADLWEEVASWAGIRRVVNMYGTTETANWIGGHSLEDGIATDGLVGRPWGGHYAIQSRGNVVERIGRGPILVSTPSLMLGYSGDDEAKGRAFVGPWFITGDHGEIDDAGNLRLEGRRENEINRGGVKIPAEEIDLLLERHPSVLEACAFHMKDAIAGEIAGAAVVLDPEQTLSEQEVIAWCRSRIRAEAVPSRIFILNVLPRSERGKLDRNVVRRVALEAGS